MAGTRPRLDTSFRAELDELLERFAGRPTPLYEAARFAPAGKRIFLKREDLLHTGAHKINNAVGQVLLAVRLGKRRIVAETGAGQHGVATATVCARFGLECVVYMGSEDMRRQAPNVERMGLLGAEVRPVEFGTRTLKEATSEAIRDWISNVESTYYLIGSCVGPHPYPAIVRELQAVIGREAREQALEQLGRLPEAVIACVGGGSNAIGLFAGFLADKEVRLVGVEAKGAASLSTGRSSVLHAIALARALCAVQLGAGLVLLDEPTAQLDVRGEAEIFGRVLAATRRCTTILISHRFSTVRQADRICVLEHGRVVELGTHDELMATEGRYRAMFELQAQRFGVDPDEEGVTYDVLT